MRAVRLGWTAIMTLRGRTWRGPTWAGAKATAAVAAVAVRRRTIVFICGVAVLRML